MRYLLLVMMMMFAPNLTFGQDETPYLPHFSDTPPDMQDETAYEEAFENRSQVLSSPYDLNKVSREELRLLNLLTDAQVEMFLAYRTQQGQLLDIYELQVIPGFDRATIEKLLPFVSVADPAQQLNASLIRRIFSPGNSYFVSRYERTLETRTGFIHPDTASQFKGSADKVYFRMRSTQPGDYSIGITGEKDAGEQMRFNPRQKQWGFDFTSWHIQLLYKGKLKNIVVGDFQMQFAQGLLLGGAFGLGKGSEAVSTSRKSNLGFLPSTSVNESVHQRGVAVTIQPFRSLNLSAFYSRNFRDARQEHASDSIAVTAFQTTGFHRSESELANRKKVLENNLGTVLHFERSNLDAGIIVHAVDFNTPVSRRQSLYNQFAFTGRRNVNAGLFINYRIQNITFFSEAGQTIGAGRAGVAGMLISASRDFDVSIVYRNYARDFQTFFSNAFSEGTSPQNERGIYWGWKYQPRRSFTFTGYADLFTFPWLGFRRYAPSQGYEWLLRMHYQPSRKASVYLQMREESKYRNLAEMKTLYRLEEGLRRNITVHCDYGVGENIRMKSRMQYNSYALHENTTEGWALVQDISLTMGRFRFSGRHALFDTDHYDNRQYVYEHDAWLAYSLPAYYGTGVRNYALIEIKAHKQLTIWLRYARTRLLKAEEIGSGLDLIKGNMKNDVKFQVRFKF